MVLIIEGDPVMNELQRIIPVILSVVIYGVLIVRMFIRIRNGPCEERIRKQRYICYDLTRLVIDGVLLTGFLLSPLYPLYFGQYDKTALGCCTAWITLIIVTLLISIFVDWFALRSEYKERYQGDHPLAHFIINQLICIYRIISWLIIVWSVLLVLEPTKSSFTEKIIVAIALIAVCRICLHLFRRHSEKSNTEEQHGTR